MEEGILKTLALGLVLALTPACLGDDPDHTAPIDIPATTSPHFGFVRPALPDALHTRLLTGIGTTADNASTNVAGIRVDLARDSATTVDAPELCTGCTVTLLHHMSDDLNSPLVHTVDIYNDQSASLLCAISLAVSVDAKKSIRADTCGTESTQTGAPPQQLPGAREY